MDVLDGQLSSGALRMVEGEEEEERVAVVEGAEREREGGAKDGGAADSVQTCDVDDRGRSERGAQRRGMATQVRGGGGGVESGEAAEGQVGPES